MVKIMVPTLLKWDDLGGFPIIFGSTPTNLALRIEAAKPGKKKVDIEKSRVLFEIIGLVSEDVCV